MLGTFPVVKGIYPDSNSRTRYCNTAIAVLISQLLRPMVIHFTLKFSGYVSSSLNLLRL